MAIKDVKAVYAGNQLQAAGILACSSEGNVLIVYRSPQVVDGSCWCSIGGKIEEGETPEQAARREFREEAGIEPPKVLYQALVYETPQLKFTNFVGSLEGQPFPRLNWESDGYCWVELGDLRTNGCRPHHYGLTALLESKEFQTALQQVNGVPFTELSSPELEQLVKIAADSVEKLRKSDVFRVLDECPAQKRKKLADYISTKRPDLKQEVEESLNDI